MPDPSISQSLKQLVSKSTNHASTNQVRHVTGEQQQKHSTEIRERRVSALAWVEGSKPMQPKGGRSKAARKGSKQVPERKSGL